MMLFEPNKKVSSLMEKFIDRLKQIKPDADIEFITADNGRATGFKNMVTQSMWIGYGLGYFTEREGLQPGHFFYVEGEYKG
jgi:hypothetical protein